MASFCILFLFSFLVSTTTATWKGLWIPLPNIPVLPPAVVAACTLAGQTGCRCGAATTSIVCPANQHCQLLTSTCLPDCPTAVVNTATRCVCPAAGGCTTCGGVVGTGCTASQICTFAGGALAGNCIAQS